MKDKLPKLPALLESKILKTGQTRGADDDEVFQNRVARNNTVLIPLGQWKEAFANQHFEGGYIVLVPPNMAENADSLLRQGLKLGKNALIFYETRADWEKYNPSQYDFKPAKSRTAPLKGHFVARIPATTATEGGAKICLGFTETAKKGAGIRFYEYATKQCIEDTRLQLEAIFWLCEDSYDAALHGGMKKSDAISRKKAILDICNKKNLMDMTKLKAARIVDTNGITVCPFCLKRLSGLGFMTKVEQASGREVPDLTITQVNLFHIEELRPGVFNHRPYNLGWGHHHCNVVVKDSGILPTLQWIAEVVERNRKAGVKL